MAVVIKNVPKMPKRQITHCECALIAYFHNTSFDGQVPFSYIGVSKLSCKACYIFILAYNKLGDLPKYYTRGSQDKWYPGWHMPTFLDAGTNDRMRSDVAEGMICTYCDFTEKQKGLSASDSTDTSMGGDHRSPSGAGDKVIRPTAIHPKAKLW
jgi:hypothetical protein